MGRYVSGGDGTGRISESIVILRESNPSLPIPDFARGGKGIAYVSGVASGGGGDADSSGGAGGSGAFAIDHPIFIPADAETIAVELGAPGNAGSQSAGWTLIRVNNQVALRLGGGGRLGGGSPEPLYSWSHSSSVGNLTASEAYSIAAAAASGCRTTFSGGAGHLSGSGKGPGYKAGSAGSSPFSPDGDGGIAGSTGNSGKRGVIKIRFVGGA